ncbi:MAG: hypothetical protein ACR2JE_11670 [Acidobacteriaceae bacterium]
MKKHFGSLVALGLLFAGLSFAGPSTAAAQEQPGGVTPPPKVLVIMREFLKPGKAGTLHQKSESAFVQAFTNAKWPEHYLGMDSLSGKSRALFIAGYDSFDAWQKDVDAVQKNATLAAALDSAQAADGELLTSYESSTWTYREDYSVRAPVKIGDMRYMEINHFRIRAGHRQDWDALVKMYVSAYEKIADAHWATFEEMYGTDSGGSYIVVTPMKSLAEVDKAQADEKQFMSSTGADQMKKMADLSAATIEWSESNVFMINPKMSYPTDTWVKADPAFWGQK